MILWLDAQISPKLCAWLGREFAVEVIHVRDLGLRSAEDSEIFERARHAQAVVLTKDEDFVELVEGRGSPPQVIWLTCGNMPNRRLKATLARALREAIRLIQSGEPVVEISEAEKSPTKREGRAKSASRRR